MYGEHNLKVNKMLTAYIIIGIILGSAVIWTERDEIDNAQDETLLMVTATATVFLWPVVFFVATRGTK